jgi:hypothetical protein
MPVLVPRWTLLPAFEGLDHRKLDLTPCRHSRAGIVPTLDGWKLAQLGEQVF